MILRWRFLAGNDMKTAFENQKCTEVSSVHVYNGSLVLKTEEKLLSKTVTFLTSTIETPTPPNVESTLSVTQWVWIAPLYKWRFDKNYCQIQRWKKFVYTCIMHQTSFGGTQYNTRRRLCSNNLKRDGLKVCFSKEQ